MHQFYGGDDMWDNDKVTPQNGQKIFFDYKCWNYCTINI